MPETGHTPSQPPRPDDPVIEFPDDPRLPQLPDARDTHAAIETTDPPDTHSIRERWARLADIGAGG